MEDVVREESRSGSISERQGEGGSEVCIRLAVSYLLGDAVGLISDSQLISVTITLADQLGSFALTTALFAEVTLEAVYQPDW